MLLTRVCLFTLLSSPSWKDHIAAVTCWRYLICFCLGLCFPHFQARLFPGLQNLELPGVNPHQLGVWNIWQYQLFNTDFVYSPPLSPLEYKWYFFASIWWQLWQQPFWVRFDWLCQELALRQFCVVPLLETPARLWFPMDAASASPQSLVKPLLCAPFLLVPEVCFR